MEKGPSEGCRALQADKYEWKKALQKAAGPFRPINMNRKRPFRPVNMNRKRPFRPVNMNGKRPSRRLPGPSGR